MWDSLHSLSTSGDPQLPTSRDTDNAITFYSCQQIFCPTGSGCNWIKLCHYFVSRVLCDSSFSSAASREKQHLRRTQATYANVKENFFSLLKIKRLSGIEVPPEAYVPRINLALFPWSLPLPDSDSVLTAFSSLPLIKIKT